MRFFALLFGFALLVQAQSVRLLRVANGFASPTEISFARDDNRMFIVEQRGRIRIVRNGSTLSTPFLDIAARVRCCGEQGLLGLAFPPQFASRQHFYVYYTDLSGSVTISRFRVSSGNADQADAGSEEVLTKIAHPDFTNHNGGHLVFGPDGQLYAGTGDGGSAGDPRGNAQNRNSLLGKLLRFDSENSTTPTPQVWAYGLRNPWKFNFDSATNDLYIADVGQDLWEEIDFAPASSTGGENYGWNRTEGLHCYPPGSSCDMSGITLPVFEYSHSVGISVTGGYVYRGRSIPDLQGAYLYGDYGGGQIWALRRSGTSWTNQQLLNTGMQISTFGQDNAGELYVGSYGEGAIYRIEAAATTISAVNAASFGDGLVPGSLASLFGPGIAPVFGIANASAFPLPTSMNNVSVAMNGTSVPVLAVASINGQDQINIQVPWELAGQQRASLVVTVNGQAGQPVDVPIAAVQSEIFVVQVRPTSWTIWATGLGSVTNAPVTGQSAPSSPLATATGTVQVMVNGRDATQIEYAGLAPGYAGLYQINFVPPDGVATNSPVTLVVNGVASRPVTAQPE